jgi:DNA-binding beta-propeller fold protein YncE
VKVFISYSRIEASETAKILHNYLSEYGHHEVFIDTSNIRGGDEWRNTIQNAISNCDIFVIIVTRSALERQYIKEEVELAKKLKKTIIPCISKRYIRNVVLPLDLNKYQGIEYENLDQLIQGIGHMFESLEKFIYQQNLEIPAQNGKNSVIESFSKEQSIISHDRSIQEDLSTHSSQEQINKAEDLKNNEQFDHDQLSTSYSFYSKWGVKGKGDGQFKEPAGIDVDSSTGYVYVADSRNNRIQKFDRDGKFITKWGTEGTKGGQFFEPHAIAINSSRGYVYVVDRGSYYNHRIQKFDTDGNFITEWDIYEDRLYGVAVDSSTGNVYAFSSKDIVLKFDSNGNNIHEWGGKGYGSGEFGEKEGRFSWRSDWYVRIAVDSSRGYVYVADNDNHRIQKFDRDGRFITKWGMKGTGNGQFDRPISITVEESTSCIYVADFNNHRIQKFDRNGKFITIWGDKGKLDGQFKYPAGITVDSSTGYVYVADLENHRIQVFAPDTE